MDRVGSGPVAARCAGDGGGNRSRHCGGNGEEQIAGGGDGVHEDGEAIQSSGHEYSREPAPPEREREGLVADPVGEEPAEIVADGNAEPSAALEPDPGMIDVGPDGVHGEISCGHDDAGEDGHDPESGAGAGRGANDEGRENPRKIADSKVGERKKDGELEDFRAHDAGEGVVAEGKAGAEAETLKKSAGGQTKEGEGENAACSVEAVTVEQGEGGRRQHMEDNDEQGGDAPGEDLQDAREGVDHEEGDEEVSGPAVVHGGIVALASARRRRQLG